MQPAPDAAVKMELPPAERKKIEDKLNARQAELQSLIAETQEFATRAQNHINEQTTRANMLQGLIAGLTELLGPPIHPPKPTDS